MNRSGRHVHCKISSAIFQSRFTIALPMWLEWLYIHLNNSLKDCTFQSIFYDRIFFYKHLAFPSARLLFYHSLYTRWVQKIRQPSVPFKLGEAWLARLFLNPLLPVCLFRVRIGAFCCPNNMPFLLLLKSYKSLKIFNKIYRSG